MIDGQLVARHGQRLDVSDQLLWRALGGRDDMDLGGFPVTNYPSALHAGHFAQIGFEFSQQGQLPRRSLTTPGRISLLWTPHKDLGQGRETPRYPAVSTRPDIQVIWQKMGI